MQSASSVQDKTVMLVLRGSQMRTRRKANITDVEVDADRSLLHLAKDLLDSDELRAITSCHQQLRLWIARRALPSPLFRSGVYLLPLELVEEVTDRIEATRKDLAQHVDAFVSAYPARVAEARERLRDLFNDSEYPSVTRVRNAFALDWSLIEWSTPSRLRMISESIYAREREKAEAIWRDATTQIRDALRESMSQLVDHLVERLAGADDGKPKRFKASTLTRVTEFLDSFATRNVVDDTSLAALVDQARDLINGVDPETLRRDASLRRSVLTGFAEVKTTLDAMMEARPRRRISFSDDE